MNQYSDLLGNTYTASDDSSVSAMSAIIEAYLGSKSSVMPQLDDLLAADPNMPMAQCLRTYLLKLAADPRFAIPVERGLAGLNAIAASLNPREQLHLQALNHWVNNQLHATVATLEQLLTSYPRDMLALRLAHYLHFYAGGATDMRASVERSLKVWDSSLPYYSYLLGMQSFGLEESGDYAHAEAIGKQAIDLNPTDIWAAHAVTHVFEMQGRHQEGIPWVASLLPHWETTNNFVYHLHWHKALCHLGVKDYETALAIYDTHLEDVIADDFYLDTCNAASLLWRLEMLGVNVGERWQALRSVSAARVTDDELIFSTLHYLMTPARLHDQPTIDRAMAQLQAWSQTNTTQGEICRDVGLPIAHALVDMSAGNPRKAAATLEQVADQIYLIGGSHAQRDLFTRLQQHCATAPA
jgi:tetratricopeptide (TPR) repeat protein